MTSRFRLTKSKKETEQPMVFDDQEPQTQRDLLIQKFDPARNQTFQSQLEMMSTLYKPNLSEYEELIYKYLQDCPLLDHQQLDSQGTEQPQPQVQSQKRNFPDDFFKNQKPDSLLECQLLSNYQIFVFQSQNLLTSFVPFLFDFYQELVETKRHQTNNKTQKGLSKYHCQQIKDNFGAEMGPKLDLPFKEIALQFKQEATQIFQKAVQQSQIMPCLQEQECTLCKQEFLLENRETTSDVLREYSEANPLVLIKSNSQTNPDSVGKAIDLNHFVTNAGVQQDLERVAEEQRMDNLIEKLRARKQQLMTQLNNS